jgi:hypothetical protein
MTFLSQFIMVFDANIDAKGDRTDHSNHHTEVSLVSIHNKSILGTLGIVVVILGYSDMDIPPQTHNQAQEAACRPPGPHVRPRRADPS